jgi:hypothetical protein
MFLYLKKLHIYLLTKCNFAEATWQAIAPHFNHQWGGVDWVLYLLASESRTEKRKEFSSSSGGAFGNKGIE